MCYNVDIGYQWSYGVGGTLQIKSREGESFVSFEKSVSEMRSDLIEKAYARQSEGLMRVSDDLMESFMAAYKAGVPVNIRQLHAEAEHRAKSIVDDALRENERIFNMNDFEIKVEHAKKFGGG